MANAERALVEQNRRLRADNARLERENQHLRQRISELEARLENSRRAGKRQAAPFSKGPPKSAPKRPGRRRGAAHGRHGHRRAPAHIDEVLDAPLPACCPHCQGALDEHRVEPQYHTELPPVRPHVTRFNVHVGQCQHCRRRVQGRHARQSSDALGAAASQLGPRASALGAYLNKALGLSFAKAARLFDEQFAVPVSRGGLCQAVARAAHAAEPTYDAMKQWLRSEPVVSPDETGWKVAGQLQWLWVFVSHSLTVYTIAPGRGFEHAAAVLGEDYDGTLVRDGWAPYRQFLHAWHQSCLAHITRRLAERLEHAKRGAARVPHALKRLFDHAFELRERRDAGTLDEHGLRVAVGKLSARLERLLDWQPTDAENAKLIKHLSNEADALFTFLLDPTVPATNHWAEQAIRPAVVTRKVCGGNRTWNGAHTQEILASFFQSCHQQQRDPFAILVVLLCAPEPTVAEVLAPVALPEPSEPALIALPP